MATDFAEAVIVLGPGGELEDLIPSVAAVAEIETDLGELVAADVVLTAAVGLDNLVQVLTPGPTPALDAALGHVVTYAMSTDATQTITISNLVAGQSLTVIATQNGAGNKALVFASTFFAGGTEPTQTATASAVDIYTIIMIGTQLYGFVAGQDMKT